MLARVEKAEKVHLIVRQQGSTVDYRASRTANRKNIEKLTEVKSLKDFSSITSKAKVLFYYTRKLLKIICES